MDAQDKTWCDQDEHALYQYYTDLNDWLDGEEGHSLREENGIANLSQPSRVGYAPRTLQC